MIDFVPLFTQIKDLKIDSVKCTDCQDKFVISDYINKTDLTRLRYFFYPKKMLANKEGVHSLSLALPISRGKKGEKLVT